jgi:hypothetical protein
MMATAPTLLQAVGLPAELWLMAKARLQSALAALDMSEDFGTVRLAVDDLPGDDAAWYRLLPAARSTPGPILAITCHIDSFCWHQPLHTTVYPASLIWDLSEAPLLPEIPDQASYSPERADMFLHHHLLTVQDLRSGRLEGQEVPPRLLEAFTAAWAVAVDGRLARRHLPCYPMPERRNSFSRLFSTGGILLPEHWQLFQALWDGALTSQSAVLGATRRLPRPLS